MAESEEALQLKRRARRRLVGAIALMTFVVIILPLILDKEPGPAGPPLNVQIPSQGSVGFSSGAVRPVPLITEKIAEPAPVKSESSPAQAKAAKPTDKPAARDAESAKAEALRAQAALNDQAWVVTLNAFSDKNNVKQLRAKLSAAGVKSYTEAVKTSKGELTRVRAGPFPSKKAAEKVRARLDAMGLKPGAVTSR